MKIIGILALQGDFDAHARMLQQLSCAYQLVRTAKELAPVDGLIIPGGESSTLLKLLNEELIAEIKKMPEAKKPIFGTCSGAILLAKEVLNPTQNSLGLVDITVERNSYGRQTESHIQQGSTILQKEPLEMVFIRAPRIKRVGQNVKVIASCNNEPVCVQQNNCLLATFHPELTTSLTLHHYFLSHF